MASSTSSPRMSLLESMACFCNSGQEDESQLQSSIAWMTSLELSMYNWEVMASISPVVEMDVARWLLAWEAVDATECAGEVIQL